MTTNKLNAIADRGVNETREALQIFYDALNKGQKSKILKNEKTKALLERYKVNVGD